MQTLKEQLKSDNVCARVMDMCTQGWPERAKQEPLLRNYWPDRATLTRRPFAKRYTACHSFSDEKQGLGDRCQNSRHRYPKITLHHDHTQ